MLAAMAAVAAIALVIALAVALASGTDSPAVDRAPTVTHVSGSGSDVTRSPDAVDRSATPTAGRNQPSRAF
jgi:hypothetical protein